MSEKPSKARPKENFDDKVTVESRRILKRLGRPQAELAQITGKSRTQINMILNGKARSSQSFLTHLSLLEKSFHGNAARQALWTELDLFPEEKQKSVAKMLVAYMRALRKEGWK